MTSQAAASQQGLRAESVSKRFAGVQALDSVDLSVERGDLLGLIGPNGSGKTTLVNVMSGFYRLSGGRVMLDSVDVSGWPAHRIARSGVCRTFQGVRLFKRLTALENVEVGAVASRAALRRQGPRRRARAALAELEVSEYAERYASDLPYGTQRRVEMARAIASDPHLLLLDEPAAGLNRAETEALSQTITQLHAQRELGVLVIDHDLRMITSLCKRIVVLDAGRVIAAGTADEVTSDSAVIAAYVGGPAAQDTRGESSVGQLTAQERST